MIPVSKPIHVQKVCRVPLRYFRGPAVGPDMPWHAYDDLLAALALPRPLRRALRAKVLEARSPICRTVEVNSEPTLIAPHYVAQGLIGAAQKVGQGFTTTPDQVNREYIQGGMAALEVLTSGLSSIEKFQYALMASHRPEASA